MASNPGPSSSKADASKTDSDVEYRIETRTKSITSADRASQSQDRTRPKAATLLIQQQLDYFSREDPSAKRMPISFSRSETS
jgi:hypothetical protein